METRHDDSDGSDIFWPGYVDATTNLVLNLLFLLTIMIVAVFMFALELGRAGGAGLDKPDDTTKLVQEVSKTTTDPVKENIALKLEIQRLKMLLAQVEDQKVLPSGSVTSTEATSKIPKPKTGLDETFAGGIEIVVRFRNEAIAFTPAEHDQLLETLKPIVDSGKTGIHVEVPVGFSEAKRLGYYRAMAVRNLLLEMEMPKEHINVSVVEGGNDADASLVKVRSR